MGNAAACCLGCLDELLELLALACYDNSTDGLVLTGDLVDKGPKSAELLRWVRESGVRAVRGNHEDLALAARLGRGRWALAGAEMPASLQFVRELSDEDVEFLEQVRVPVTAGQSVSLGVGA